MPTKQTTRRAKKALKQGKTASTAAGEFVREEMHHMEEDKHPVKSREQAIAIGLSKAREAGIPIPAKNGATKAKPRAKKSSSTKAKKKAA